MALNPINISLPARNDLFLAAKYSPLVDVATATPSHASYFSLKNNYASTAKGDV